MSAQQPKKRQKAPVRTTMEELCSADHFFQLVMMDHRCMLAWTTHAENMVAHDPEAQVRLAALRSAVLRQRADSTPAGTPEEGSTQGDADR